MKKLGKKKIRRCCYFVFLYLGLSSPSFFCPIEIAVVPFFHLQLGTLLFFSSCFRLFDCSSVLICSRDEKKKKTHQGFGDGGSEEEGGEELGGKERLLGT